MNAKQVIYGIAAVLLLGLLGCASIEPCNHTLEREGFLTTSDGVRLYYKVKGTGPQKVIIPFATRFGDGDFNAITEGRTVYHYDPRFHGFSEAVELSQLSFERDLEDLEEVRAYFGLKRFSLIGVEYFGNLAIHYARLCGVIVKSLAA